MRSRSRCRTSVRQDLTSSTAAAAALNPPKLTLSGLLCPTFSHILTTFFYLIFLQHFFPTRDQDFCIRWPRVYFYKGEWVCVCVGGGGLEIPKIESIRLFNLFSVCTPQWSLHYSLQHMVERRFKSFSLSSPLRSIFFLHNVESTYPAKLVIFLLSLNISRPRD